MKKHRNIKLFIISFILMCIMALSLFSEGFYKLTPNFKKTPIEDIMPVSENKTSQYEYTENNLATLQKRKKDSLNLCLNLENDNFTMDNNNLIQSDLLTVAVNGGQTIKNTIDILRQKGYNIEDCFNLLYTNWNSLLNSFLSKYEIEPINSEVSFNPNSVNMFSYSQHKVGKLVNKKTFYNELYSKLDNKKIKIDLSLEETAPEFTIEKNKSITKEVSHFITDLVGSKKNRHHNVTTALKKLNGMKIEPNQKISFNKITSPHDASGGYTSATIISNGEYINGMGGGICQASTTLYNAVLLAGLKVYEVSKHSIPVKYVKMGLDSMVSSYSDMVFENTSPYPIYIRAYTDKESAYIYLYGKTMENNEYIVRRNEIVKTIPAPATITVVDTKQKYYPKIKYKDESFELKYARKGYEVNAYLDYYKDNKLIKSEKIRHEIYTPQAKVIVIGAKDREIVSNNDSTTNKKASTNNENNENLENNTITSDSNIKDNKNLSQATNIENNNNKIITEVIENNVIETSETLTENKNAISNNDCSNNTITTTT